MRDAPISTMPGSRASAQATTISAGHSSFALGPAAIAEVDSADLTQAGSQIYLSGLGSVFAARDALLDDARAAFEPSDRTLFLDDAPELGQPPEHGAPVCGSCASDPDGDRWGWEHERSCRVASWCLAPSDPICKRCASDPDGDGWGWEDARSCVKLASCT